MSISVQLNLKVWMVMWCMLLTATSAYAIDINPGESRTECPGVKIKLGGDPVAGPDPISEYQILWVGSNGWSSSEANPEIEVPTEKTVYTVKVTDKDGFMCSKQVTITPVKVKDMTFTPTTLPADGKSTATGKVVVEGTGRTIVWSIQGPSGTDATVNENSGVVKAGVNPDMVKVRAQDKKAVDEKLETCYVEENICVGDPSKCCADVSGNVKFGPINMNLSEAVKSSGSESDGYCSYNTNKAQVNLSLMGFFVQNYEFKKIESVSVVWKQKQTEDGMVFKDVTITWSGAGETREFGGLMGTLVGLSVKVNADGVISGTVKFQINQTKDVSLGGIAVVAAGTTGTFTYKYKGSSAGFEGDYDFGGITDISIQLKKNKTIAEVRGKLTSEGNFDAELIGKVGEKFSIKGFGDVTFKSLKWRFLFRLKDKEIVFKDGKAGLTVRNIRNTKGDISIDLELDGNTCSGTAKFDDFTAFGCAVEGTLGVSTDTQFESLQLTGKNITGKHPDFDAAFKISEFVIDDGELKVFDFSGDVKYKGVIFQVSKANFEKNKGLVITAKVTVGGASIGGQMDVVDFKISSDGQASIGKIVVAIEAHPLSARGSIAFDKGSFTGTYTGELKGQIKIAGVITLGNAGAYNYAYFELSMKSPKGFRIGPVIQVDELGGKFGYNYTLGGTPQQGSYLMGILLGVRDGANIVSLRGEVTIQLGHEKALDIVGQVKVPAKSPVVNAKIAASYYLGTNQVDGLVNTAIKIPAKDGSKIHLKTSDIKFKINESGWSVKTGEMSCNILNKVLATAKLDLLGNGEDGLSGNATGTWMSTHSLDIHYPKTFDGTNCATADNTSNALGFGIKGSLALAFSGGFNVGVNDEGFVGSIQTNVAGSSNFVVKWPCLSCEEDCVDRSSAAASGTMYMSNEGNKIVLEGTVNFKGGAGDAATRKLRLEFE